MKIKTQITLWVGLLSFLIVLLTGMGVWSLHDIKEDTDHILTSNYLSIGYAQNMLEALDRSFHDEEAVLDFRQNLEKQKNKNRELEEAALIDRIEQNFEKLIGQPDNQALQEEIRRDLIKDIQQNLEAIAVKSNRASEKTKMAITRVIAAGVVCFIIAFILFIQLPRSIAAPIAKLMKGTQEIARKNYAHRIQVKRGGEFKNLATSFNAMSGKLEEYASFDLSKLWIEKKRIETIINAIYDPIIILDEHRTLLFINKEALKVADLERDRVLGKNIRDIAQTNIFIHSVINNGSSATKDSGKNEKQELKIQIDGAEHYFEMKYLDLSSESFAGRKERKIGTLILLQNITSHKKLDIAKTNYIASLSHNFKTPISSTQIGLHLLRKNQVGKLNKEQRQLIDSIEEDIEKLLSITGDLLKISEVESENIQLKISSINLRDIIDYAVNTIQRQADQKSIRLAVDLPVEIPPIKGDAEKIAWVLINLISNAIRYSKENSTVHIQLEQRDRCVYLSVADQGQGIPPEYRKRIFARYFRAPGTDEKGTGLGLAISKEFMEAQGGTIELESSLGEGSKFTIVMKKGSTTG